MTRYFIDTSDGVVALTDEIGADLTQDMARSEALRAACDMASDRVHERGSRDLTVDVRDQRGDIVYAVKLSLIDTGGEP